MSETEATNSVADNEEASSVDADAPKTENDNEAEKKEELNTTDERKTSEPEEKPSAGSNDKESEKKCDDVEVPATAASTKPTLTSNQAKPGECNLLPVLVERLRSALEQSCSSNSSCEEPLPLEDSGVDSEEDLRMWASGLCNTIEQNNQSPKPLDLKFLEDLLLSDIQTALSRLQETLKRVDLNTLTKYNSTLDSTNKLHLLRLISNLLSRLKIPEELTKIEDNNATAASSANQKPSQSNQRRRSRSNRHTIGVSAEEIAHARKLLDEKNLNSGIADSVKEIKPIEPEIVIPEVVEKPAESIFNKPVAAAAAVVQTAVVQNPVQNQPELKTFEQVREKHVKDAINQQQTYYSKNKEFYKGNNSFYHNQPTEINSEALNRVEIPFKDENFDVENEEYGQQSIPAFYQQPAIASKYNKFGAKKSKIKRANTIDIPNYMKLQAENFGQNQAISLRRPIDIGDKNFGNNTNIIPAFKPKTDNDRKFLALINKNNDAAPSSNNLPFKSFNYRQPANIDKNWNSRFSNIKTTFDKPSSNYLPSELESLKPHGDSSRRSQSGASDSGESDGVVVGSLRLAYAAPPPPPKQKQGGFTHAPTSPFQRIEKSSNRNENTSIFKSGYLPKGGSNSLQAKVKIFNQDNSGNSNTNSSIVAQNKNKFNKMSDQSQAKISQVANFTYNPAYKLNPDSNKSLETINKQENNNTVRSAYLPGNQNVISSKLTVNANLNEDSLKGNKIHYPYNAAYNSSVTSKNKTDKVSSNDEENSYGTRYQNPHNSYQDKFYAAGYSSQQKNVDVPARSSSHSFMLAKIANDNNSNFDNKPKINTRYVNEALKIKDNRESMEKNRPILQNSHYVKPSPPPPPPPAAAPVHIVKNYPNNENKVGQNRGVVKNQHVVYPAHNYPIQNIKNLNKTIMQEFNPQKIKTQNVEYKPLQAYATYNDNIRLNNVTNDDDMSRGSDLVQSMQNNDLAQNLYSTGYYAQQANNNDSDQFYAMQNRASQNLKAEQNYAARGLPKPFDLNCAERYLPQSVNDVNSNKIRNNSDQETKLQNYSLPYDENTDRFSAGPINSITGKVQNDYNQGLKNHLQSNYAPYLHSYQTKRDNDHDEPINFNQESGYRNVDNSTIAENDRLQNYGNYYAEIPPLNQTSQSSSFHEDNSSEKEILSYDTTTEPEESNSSFNPYQKDLLLEDENIQNQDISSDGVVTRYQCAIATVATTPESSEADLTEVNPFPNAKLYNLKIAAYPSAPNEHSPIMNVNYGAFNQPKIVANKATVEKEEMRDESADAFDEIQRHNLLQQQIIQKLQNDDNSSKNIRRRSSLDKFKWEDKSAGEIADRRCSFYERFKGEDRSPTSPSAHFPLNKSNSPPPNSKQTEEPVIECNNTLEKINIFEEKSLQPLAPTTRQRFRPLSIPKFDKSKDHYVKPPKINVVIPSKIVKPKTFADKGSDNDNRNEIINSSTNICDSSDEYLMSCANRQSRSIVLSKSESWHQLALSRGNLQPPQPNVTSVNHLLKPPKPKSPASLKLSKQYEASSSSDNMKKMEEKIQRYFNSPTNIPANSESSLQSSMNSRRESTKSKRHFSSKKTSQSNSGLARSQTMPHLYDEKLIIDENTDVEKAFDSLFKEATKSDNRY